MLVTNMGNITIKLDTEKAPVSSKNFIRYVNDKSYQNSIFHRVINGFMIQGGGFSEDFKRLDTYTQIENESQNGLSNTRGSIAMARTGQPHSATRQFYINLVDNTNLDGESHKFGYAVFGQVTRGMDVVDKIAKVATGSRSGMRDVPRQNVVLLDVIYP
ncbi:peptidylprolyl isomerase [Alginatibacterium sediminis]